MVSVRELGQRMGWNIITDAPRVHEIIKKNKVNVNNDDWEEHSDSEFIDDFEVTNYKFTWVPILINRDKNDFETKKQECWAWLLINRTTVSPTSFSIYIFSTPYTSKKYEEENSTEDLDTNVADFMKAITAETLFDYIYKFVKSYELETHDISTNRHTNQHFSGVYLINTMIELLKKQTKNPNFLENFLEQDPPPQLEGIVWTDEQVKTFRSKWKKERKVHWCNWNSPLGSDSQEWKDLWETIEKHLIKLIEEKVDHKKFEAEKKVIKYLNGLNPQFANFPKLSEWDRIQAIEKVKNNLKKHFVSSPTTGEIREKIEAVMMNLNDWNPTPKPPLDLDNGQLARLLRKITLRGRSLERILTDLQWDLETDFATNNYVFKEINDQMSKLMTIPKGKRTLVNKIWDGFFTTSLKIYEWVLIPFVTPNTGRWVLLAVKNNKSNLDKSTTVNQEYFFLSASSEKEWREIELVWNKANDETDRKYGEEGWIEDIAKSFGWKKFKDFDAFFPSQITQPEDSGKIMVFNLVYLVLTKLDRSKLKDEWQEEWEDKSEEFFELIKDPNTQQIKLETILDLSKIKEDQIINPEQQKITEALSLPDTDQEECEIKLSTLNDIVATYSAKNTTETQKMVWMINENDVKREIEKLTTKIKEFESIPPKEVWEDWELTPKLIEKICEEMFEQILETFQFEDETIAEKVKELAKGMLTDDEEDEEINGYKDMKKVIGKSKRTDPKFCVRRFFFKLLRNADKDFVWPEEEQEIEDGSSDDEPQTHSEDSSDSSDSDADAQADQVKDILERRTSDEYYQFKLWHFERFASDPTNSKYINELERVKEDIKKLHDNFEFWKETLKNGQEVAEGKRKGGDWYEDSFDEHGISSLESVFFCWYNEYIREPIGIQYKIKMAKEKADVAKKSGEEQAWIKQPQIMLELLKLENENKKVSEKEEHDYQVWVKFFETLTKDALEAERERERITKQLGLLGISKQDFESWTEEERVKFIKELEAL